MLNLSGRKNYRDRKEKIMKKYNEEQQEAREVSGEGDGVVKSQSPTA